MTIDELREHIERGRAAWPELALRDEDFASYLEALPEAGVPPLEHAADLWIACACALGVTGAAASFERVFRSTLERAVARVDRSVVEDATQTALVSLLVRQGDRAPRISSYSGRAAMRTWLTTVAMRAAHRLRRNLDDRPHESLSAVSAAVVDSEPELAFAKTRYAQELEGSLRDALARLEPRQVVLLRLHHAQGWSVDRLGAFYSIGRSTAARWVASARSALLAETKRLMKERVQLTSTELDSLVVLLQSNLEVSLLRLLDPKE